MAAGGLNWKAAIPAALCSILMASSALAQPADSFEALVKKLDAPELAARELATSDLAQGERFSLPMIEKALTDPALSPEQRQRLRWVGQQLFGRTARAAMGISFLDWEDSGAVVAPVEGFDSERVLRAGDLLGMIDGVRISSQLDVRQIIISHDPGDEVVLGIVRSGTPMTVTVKMGRLADLPRMTDRLTPSALNGAWTHRLARLGEPRPAPIETSLTIEQWRETAERAAQAEASRPEQMHDPFTGEPVRSVMNRPAVSTLVLGGQSRLAVDDGGSSLVRGGPVFIQRGARGNILVRDGEINLRDVRADVGALRDQLRAQRQQLQGVVAANTAQINDPAVPEVVRAQLKIENQKVLAALQALDTRLQQLTRVPEVRP